MGKIIEYRIYFRFSVYDLEQLINSLIKEGWEPFGGVSNYQDRYSQAMVLRESSVPTKKAKVNAAGA